MKNIKGPLMVRVTLLNATQRALFGEWPPGAEFGEYSDLRSLYKDMKSEWGGRVSKMYRDLKDRDGIQVGWVFTKKMQYEDSKEWYVREAWVEVVKASKPAQRAEFETVAIS
jgi:hypothetical protein